MKKLFPKILLVLILFSCASSPKQDEQLKAIEDALYDELNNKNIILWKSGIDIISIDLNNNYKLKNVIADIIPRPVGTNYDKYVQLTYYFTNGDENETIIHYIGHYSYNGDLVSECIRLAHWSIIEIGRNNPSLPDTRKPGRDLLIINNDALKNAHSRLVNEIQRSQQNRIGDNNRNKLVALLLNPLSVGYFGQFSRGDTVNIPRAFLRVIDLQQSGNTYNFLVMVNDNNISKPFYIITNRMFNLMDRNTIFEELVIQYVGTDNYLSNGITRETFVFQLSR